MKAFISHTSTDKPIAEAFAQELFANGVDVWLDKYEIRAGDSLSDRIEDGLKQVDAVVILLSSNAVKSKWVREELRMALQRRLQDENFMIIPVLLDECEVPLFLRDYRFIDWRRGARQAFVEALVALKRIITKPSFAPEFREARVEFVHVSYSVSFEGKRGERAIFRERSRAISKVPLEFIDRQLDFAGSITSIESSGCTILRRAISSQQERWRLAISPPIPVGTEFEYGVTYTLNGAFEEDEPIWTYAIEAPTQRLETEFDFRDATPIDQFTVLHRVGMTTYDEPTPVVCLGQLFKWDKILPLYKDAYEFRFQWRLGATD